MHNLFEDSRTEFKLIVNEKLEREVMRVIHLLFSFITVRNSDKNGDKMVTNSDNNYSDHFKHA